jgi:hypothetical protein
MMNRWIARNSAVAALLLLNGAVALAQSGLRLEVPFTFHTPTATMAPGHYVVQTVNGSQPVPVYSLRNLDNGQKVLLFSASRTYRSADQAAKPELMFRCVGEYCALAAIYPAFKDVGDAIPMSLKAAPKHQQLAVVRIPALR